MRALVMCGGRGTRLDAPVEKPLLEVAGEPMVDRVLDALASSRVTDCYAAVSPRAPETAAHVAVPTIETPGDGYVSDLQTALADERVSRPVVTVVADLPLLDGEAVDAVLDAYDARFGVHDGGRDEGLGDGRDAEGSLTVAVPVETKRALGVSVDTTFEHEGRDLAPAGVNVVGDGPDATHVLDDDRLAVNVNRPRDARIAAALLGPDSRGHCD